MILNFDALDCPSTGTLSMVGLALESDEEILVMLWWYIGDEH